ncbi:MAG: glutaredoxin [Candidatus Thiodiazotropha endolucinida]
MKYLLLILILFGAYHWYTNNHQEQKGFTGASHDRLIMYSLTTCGYCKSKSKELRSAGVKFVEYFIDKNSKRREELNQKLSNSGFPPRSYGTPIFDAYGFMLLDNPTVSQILALKQKSE